MLSGWSWVDVDVLVAFLIGMVSAWWIGVIRRDSAEQKARRARFTETTERAAYVKLNEKSFKDHPSMRELDDLDDEWYV